ncbi:MAG: hypothetical protein JJE30_08880 [Desulfuromonadales bacterium]|nr:hypothetical protein [Desulfuromonadales bacterium]
MPSKNPTRDRTRQRIADAIIPDDPRISLDEFQVAKLLNVSVHKLRRDRWAGGGIPFIKLSENGIVRYQRTVIDQRMHDLTRLSTSDTGQKRSKQA